MMLRPPLENSRMACHPYSYSWPLLNPVLYNADEAFLSKVVGFVGVSKGSFGLGGYYYTARAALGGNTIDPVISKSQFSDR